MPGELKSGSERENVLSAFHNHPDLSLPGEHIELDELLLDNPGYFEYQLDQEFEHSEVFTNVGYNEYSTESAIEIYRSDQYLDEQDVLLEALVTHSGILNGVFLEEKYIEFVNQRTPSDTYIEKDNGNLVNHLAHIRVPESFDGVKLQTSVNEAVSMLKRAVDLQKNMVKVATSF